MKDKRETSLSNHKELFSNCTSIDYICRFSIGNYTDILNYWIYSSYYKYLRKSFYETKYKSETNIQKRLAFAKTFVNKPAEFWNNVIFPNESKFSIFASYGKKRFGKRLIHFLKLKN